MNRRHGNSLNRSMSLQNHMESAFFRRFMPDIKRKKYKMIAEKGYLTYDFFLPGLILDALYRGDGTYLEQWAKEQIKREYSYCEYAWMP